MSKNISADHAENAVTFIKTRLTGRVTTEQTIDDIINKLQNNIKGDSSCLLNAKILNCKQNSKDAATFAAEIEPLTGKLQNAYISEGVPYHVAKNYTTLFFLCQKNP